MVSHPDNLLLVGQGQNCIHTPGRSLVRKAKQWKQKGKEDWALLCFAALLLRSVSGIELHRIRSALPVKLLTLYLEECTAQILAPL